MVERRGSNVSTALVRSEDSGKGVVGISAAHANNGCLIYATQSSPSSTLLQLRLKSSTLVLKSPRENSHKIENHPIIKGTMLSAKLSA